MKTIFRVFCVALLLGSVSAGIFAAPITPAVIAPLRVKAAMLEKLAAGQARFLTEFNTHKNISAQDLESFSNASARLLYSVTEIQKRITQLEHDEVATEAAGAALTSVASSVKRLSQHAAAAAKEAAVLGVSCKSKDAREKRYAAEIEKNLADVVKRLDAIKESLLTIG